MRGGKLEYKHSIWVKKGVNKEDKQRTMEKTYFFNMKFIDLYKS